MIWRAKRTQASIYEKVLFNKKKQGLSRDTEKRREKLQTSTSLLHFDVYLGNHQLNPTSNKVKKKTECY